MEAGIRCLCWLILCWVIPPLAVGLIGGCTINLLINIILELFLHVPGLSAPDSRAAAIHATWYVLTYPERHGAVL